VDPQTVKPPDDLLQLTFCPHCDYSLQGLPSTGKCPECGQDYDQSFAIIRCFSPTDNRSVYQQWPFLLPGVLLVVMMFIWPMIFMQPVMFLAIAFFVVMFVMNWIDRLTSPRRGMWLLWIAPTGIGVQTDFDPSSLIAHTRRWLPQIYPILSNIAVCIPLLHILGLRSIILMAAITAFSGTISWLIRRASRLKLAAQPMGNRPALIAWDQVTRIQMLQRKAGRFILKAHQDSWVSKRCIINIRFEGTLAFAQKLKERITTYSGQIVYPNVLLSD
jgi:hypothetical protein